jgi:hypothetical protein
MKTYQELQKEYGFVTEEIWSDPEFRRKCREKIFDSGFNAQYDKTPQVYSEDIHKPVDISPTSR